jgi:selenocysteine lyase/cysteine desulfurase
VVFLAQCDIIGRQVLIWASDLQGIVNTEAGIVVRYRCACGEPAEMLTGSGSDVRVSLHLGLAA